MFKKGNEIFEERFCELNNVYSQSLNSVYCHFTYGENEVILNFFLNSKRMVIQFVTHIRFFFINI